MWANFWGISRWTPPGSTPDRERSWGFSDLIRSSRGNIQLAAVQFSDESLLALMRTGGAGGYIRQSRSFSGLSLDRQMRDGLVHVTYTYR